MPLAICLKSRPEGEASVDNFEVKQLCVDCYTLHFS